MKRAFADPTETKELKDFAVEFLPEISSIALRKAHSGILATHPLRALQSAAMYRGLGAGTAFWAFINMMDFHPETLLVPAAVVGGYEAMQVGKAALVRSTAAIRGVLLKRKMLKNPVKMFGVNATALETSSTKLALPAPATSAVYAPKATAIVPLPKHLNTLSPGELIHFAADREDAVNGLAGDVLEKQDALQASAGWKELKAAIEKIAVPLKKNKKFDRPKLSRELQTAIDHRSAELRQLVESLEPLRGDAVTLKKSIAEARLQGQAALTEQLKQEVPDADGTRRTFMLNHRLEALKQTEQILQSIELGLDATEESVQGTLAVLRETTGSLFASVGSLAKADGQNSALAAQLRLVSDNLARLETTK